MPEPGRLLDAPAEVAELVDRLRGSDVVAIDTEFIREQSFLPRLEIVQLAGPDGTMGVVDVAAMLAAGAPDGLDPLRELLSDPRVLKVFHAADQDLEVLQALGGPLVSPMFDTQVAAGFVGYGAGLGYGALVEAYTGTRLQKGEKLTDWSRRPLTPEQLAYALDDVRYLLPVYDAIQAELLRRGRLPWAIAECEALAANVQANLDLRADPLTAYLRVRGRGALDARGLQVLRELTAWREAEARRVDRPRGSVIKDELLVEVARRAPRDPRQLSGLRGFNPRELERHGKALVAGVERALAEPRNTWPQPEPRGNAPDEGTLALADLLQAITHFVAAEAGIAGSLLATKGELARLAAGDRELPVLQGWRRDILGNRLLAMVEGACTLAWDPRGRTIRICT